MQNPAKIFVIAVAIFVLPSVFFAQGSQPQAGRGQGRREGRGSTASSPTAKLPFEPHDLNGIWSRNPTNGGGGTCADCGDLGFNKDVPPMTAWGEAKFNENRPSYGRPLGSPLNGEHIGRVRAIAPGQGNDIVTACNPEGVTRVLIQPNPMEIVQLPNRIFELFEWNYQRREIWMDGRQLTKEHDWPRWFGYSVAKWEGDTLVVDSNGFDERTWLDHFGYPHSDEMHLQERYRRIDHDTLELVFIVDDPKTYTKPWVSETKRFKLQTREQLTYDGWYGLMEALCAPVDATDQFIERVVKPAGGVGGVLRK
jgi:hypothetical protein